MTTTDTLPTPSPTTAPFTADEHAGLARLLADLTDDSLITAPVRLIADELLAAIADNAPGQLPDLVGNEQARTLTDPVPLPLLAGADVAYPGIEQLLFNAADTIERFQPDNLTVALRAMTRTLGVLPDPAAATQLLRAVLDWSATLWQFTPEESQTIAAWANGHIAPLPLPTGTAYEAMLLAQEHGWYLSDGILAVLSIGAHHDLPVAETVVLLARVIHTIDQHA